MPGTEIKEESDRQIPDGGLRGFLDFAAEIERQAFERNSELMGFLSEIDAAFKPLLFQGKSQAPPTPSLLMMNSYASWLGAVRTALSGQSPPVFMILRGSLESAAYALLARDKANETIYYERERNKAACRDAFTMRKAVVILEKVDPNLGKFFKEHNEAQIDLGAHPNTKSVFHHLTIKERNDGMAGVLLTVLHDPSSDSIVQTLMACVEVGIALLCICPHVLPEQEAAGDCHGKGVELHAAKEKWINENHPYASASTS